jgi:hypothetical protein
MHTMPSLDYMGYAVVVYALPAPNDRYYSVFTIRRHTSHTLAMQAPVSHQEGVRAAITCETADLARRRAAHRARAWIDAHPAL